MGGTTHENNKLSIAEKRLIGIESLQWCANNAVYFLGLIGAATYDLAGTAFLVAEGFREKDVAAYSHAL